MLINFRIAQFVNMQCNKCNINIVLQRVILYYSVPSLKTMICLCVTPTHLGRIISIVVFSTGIT